jgi:CubicO group peptidase (beta-lactamase class C family)
MPTPSVQLAPSFQQQDVQFHRAFGIVREAIEKRAFPGASIAVTIDGRLLVWKAIGRFTYDPESPSVSPTTIYDLASLSKAIATTTMAMILVERGALRLDDQVGQYLPQFVVDKDVRRKEVTIRMLLAHSSGLPAYEKLFLHAVTRDELVAGTMQAPLVADPGTVTEYSDLGFILLGELLSKVADESLDRFSDREIFDPLGMAGARFVPPPQWATQIPPTEDDINFRHRIIQGEVNDENSSVMGGISGHAGVFGSALDVATFAHCVLNGGSPIVKAETIAMFTRRETTPTKTSRALGWDTPSAPSQSGKLFGPRSYGHLGFTGTSLWCDPDRKLSVTLLTNRTWPDRSSQEIKRVRPIIHDAILEAIGEQ